MDTITVVMLFREQNLDKSDLAQATRIQRRRTDVMHSVVEAFAAKGYDRKPDLFANRLTILSKLTGEQVEIHNVTTGTKALQLMTSNKDRKTALIAGKTYDDAMSILELVEQLKAQNATPNAMIYCSPQAQPISKLPPEVSLIPFNNVGHTGARVTHLLKSERAATTSAQPTALTPQ